MLVFLYNLKFSLPEDLRDSVHRIKTSQAIVANKHMHCQLSHLSIRIDFVPVVERARSLAIVRCRCKNIQRSLFVHISGLLPNTESTSTLENDMKEK